MYKIFSHPVVLKVSPASPAIEDGARQLGSRAYDQLLDMILSGELGGGALLHEQALARLLDTSRTPVREALLRLEAEGLVARHAGRVLAVREVPVREFMEILRVRSVLETEAIGQACKRIPDSKLRELRATVEALLAVEAPDAETQMQADDELHCAIVDACENTVLAELVRGLRRRTRLLNLKSLPDRFVPGCREHLAIIAAIERRDEEGARAALASHFENVRQSVLGKLGAI
jgi:DNA-binding GntR family transcriptional regulator